VSGACAPFVRRFRAGVRAGGARFRPALEPIPAWGGREGSRIEGGLPRTKGGRKGATHFLAPRKRGRPLSSFDVEREAGIGMLRKPTFRAASDAKMAPRSARVSRPRRAIDRRSPNFRAPIDRRSLGSRRCLPSEGAPGMHRCLAARTDPLSLGTQVEKSGSFCCAISRVIELNSWFISYLSPTEIGFVLTLFYHR
jgi:hypothetical protein